MTLLSIAHHIKIFKNILHDKYLGYHPLSKRLQLWSGKWKLDLKLLLLDNWWYVDLYLHVEHVIRFDLFLDLIPMLLVPTIKIINQIAAIIPIIISLIENLELDVGCLASLDSGQILVRRDSIDLWDMLNLC